MSDTRGLGFLLHNAARALARRFEARTGERSLTMAQWRLLAQLGREGPQRQARLAAALEVEPISVSRLVDRMARAGWVARLPDPDDRRATLVSPTARARAALGNAGAVADAVHAEALDGFSAAERAQLAALLARLTNNLAALRDAPSTEEPR